MATAPAMGHNTAPAMGPLTQCLVPNPASVMGPLPPSMGLNQIPMMNQGMHQPMMPNTVSAMMPSAVPSAVQAPGPNPPAVPQKAAASNLSEVDRGRIVGMWEAGRKPSAIATAIPCSKRTACKWINAYRNCGKEGLIDLRRSGLAGRPRKTTEDENLAIIKAMDENHTRAATSSALAALKLRVSDRTIRRRLQEARAERRKRTAHSSRSAKVNSVNAKAQKGGSKLETFNPIPPPLPPIIDPLKDPMHVQIEPSTHVEVNMDATPLPDSASYCYVNL